MNSVYIIGNGYIGSYIVANKPKSVEFIGVCRSDKNNCDENIRLDISQETRSLMNLINKKSDVVYLAPPQQNGTVDMVLQNFLANINKENINHLVYISTSGVYGDRNDSLVDESANVNPLTDRAKRRVNAESQIKKSGLKYTILRVPGIYGKGRLPLKRIKERLPLIKKEICKHTNLIHANDLAKVIIMSIGNTDVVNLTINVSDGTAIKTTAYYLYIYDQLGLEYPDFIDYEAARKEYDPKRMSFLNESRILDTTLMNKIFPDIIEFTDIKKGIRDSLEN